MEQEKKYDEQQRVVDLLEENHRLKDELTFFKDELTHRQRLNRWAEIADAVNAFRIFPRLFLGAYIALFFKAGLWFMGLDDPTIEQSGFVSLITGAGAAWFSIYVGNSKFHK